MLPPTRRARTPRAGQPSHVSRSLSVEALESRMLMTLQGNQLFPSDNPWNQSIASAPVASNSSTLVASIGASRALHPDFGTVYNGALNGIPFNVVPGTQPKVNVIIDAYADESDIVPVPIPAGAVLEGDPLPPAQNTGDRHLIVYDSDHNFAYELFNVHRPSEESDNQWHADSEAVWDMSKDSFRTPGFTSADAAGLPILPGLVRPDEVLDQGVINHALRFTVPSSDNAYVFPASHEAGVNNVALPRMGERFRLKSSFDISGFSAPDRVILQALKTYGMIVADNGSSWYLSGEPSSRWSDDDLHALTSVLGSNFEAIDLTPRCTSLGQSSGSTAGGTTVTIHGQNFSGAAGQLQVFFGATPVASASISVLNDTTLTVTSPAHAAGTVDVTVQTPYGTTATSGADHFTYTVASNSSVVGRDLFYDNTRNQAYDAGAGVDAHDDLAIDTSKTAYLPGVNEFSTAAQAFTHESGYMLGINGIMIDVSGTHGTITASDFVFKTGDDNGFAVVPTSSLPTQISVRTGAGVGGSDRIEIVWGATTNTNSSIVPSPIRNTWLEVELKANANTNLAVGSGVNWEAGIGDRFFFASLQGDAGNTGTGGYTTNAADEITVRNGPQGTSGITITSPTDLDRNGAVNANDQIETRNARTISLDWIDQTTGPYAPAASTSGAVASALAASSGSSGWVTGRLASMGDLNSGSAASYFQSLASSGTSEAVATLEAADAEADNLGLDDELLDELLADLGAE